MSIFETKLARFRKEQERKKMSKSYRREVAKKLKEQIDTATDPKVIADLANVLAKYLPKPKPPRRRPGTPVGPIKAAEQTVDDMVAVFEKKRKGLPLTEVEKQMVAPFEKRGEARIGEKNV